VYPGSGGPIYSSGIVMDTNWHHAIWTYSAALGKQIIFLDGVEVGSITSAALQVGTANIFKIGNGYLNTTLANVSFTGNNQFFEGLIDDVNITTTLKTGNVLQLFNDIKVYEQTPASLIAGYIPICAGVSTTTQVLVGNSGLSYQWFEEITKGTLVPLLNGTNYSGVRANILTINSMPSTYLNLVNKITDNFCNSVDINANLTGILNSTIISQPVSKTICVGGTTMFTINVAGGQSYIWKKNGVAISNSNNDTLILTNITTADFTSYTCEVTGCNNVVINSNAATLSAPAAIITTNPTVSNSLVCLGNSIFIYVVAQNAVNYQWKKNGVAISNSNKDTLFINAVQSSDVANYTCEITGCSNNLLVSSPATFTITTNFATNNLLSYWKFDNNLTPTVGTNTFTPTNTSYSFTTDRANIVNKAVVLTATNNALALASPVATDNISVSLWYKRVGNTAGEAIIGSNSTNYGDMLFINSFGYLGYQVGGSGFQSLGVIVTNGWHHFVVTKAGTTTKIYVDGNNITIPTTIVAPPVMGSGTNNTQINRFGNTAPIYNTNGAKGTFDEIRIYSSVLTAIQVSSLFQMAEFNSISGFGAVCIGSTASALVNVTAGPNATYQWLKNGNPIQGANAATYNITNVQATDTGSYSCLIGLSTACAGVYSTNIGLSIVQNNLAITTQPANQNICPLQQNNFITFQVNATGTNLTYQWKKNGINISNATNSIYQVNIANVANNDSFTVMVSNGCSSILSNIALVKFIDALQITSQPTNLNVCANTNALFVIKTNGQNVTYIWEKNGISIPNSNNDSLLITNVTAADVTNYRVLMSYVCGNVISNTVTLSISNSTQITSQPVSQTVCTSQGFNFSVTATGDSLQYQWKLNGNNIQGANSSSFSKTLVSAADSGNYTVSISGTCGSENSTIAKLSIVNNISILTQPSAVNLCQGSTSYLSLIASGNSNTYTWFKNGTAVANSNNDTLYLNNLSSNNAGNYICEVTSSCGTVNTTITAVSVKAKSVFNFNKTICNGETFTFKGNALSQSGNYYDTTSNMAGCDSIITLNLIVNTPLTVTISNNQNVLTATAGLSNYQWYLNNTIIAGATNLTHTAIVNGDYTVKVKDATNCNATSNTLVIQNVGLATLNPLTFTIYPNPAIKTLSIESNTNIIDIQIFALSGALVKNAVLTNNTIAVDDLTSGIYLIKVTDNKGYNLTRKFVKQ
ncbi:MAG: LamG-like jellyroll fold domain-containing protein, partial [Candidatus Methylacidiphilales bacterium]